MANTAETLRNSLLSATQIAELTGWPNQLILDYLTIIQNFVDLAEIIDSNESTLSARVADAEQLIQLNAQLIGQLIGRVHDIDKALIDIDSSLTQILNGIALLNQLVQQNATAIGMINGQINVINKRLSMIEQIQTVVS